MTQEKFKQAKELEQRIFHIENLIEVFSLHRYELKPPTRMTSYNIVVGIQNETILNEGEVALFLEALKNEKIRLEQKFATL